MSELGELLDLSRPELADVAAALADGDEQGAAEELKDFYAHRTSVELPEPGTAGVGDASADELADGIFRFDGVTRDFYDEDEQRIDIDWQDTWGGTEEVPGRGQVWMSDFAFMPTLTWAYMSESNPQVRAEYAQAWMEITLDFFADNPDWPRVQNLAGAKRLSQLIASFSVFRTEPTIDAGELVDYLIGVDATTAHLVDALQAHRGNNWFLSMARSIYISSVYLPELAESHEQEYFAVRSFESYLTQHGAQFKGDGVYREPTVNYQAYAADLVNSAVEVGELNDRTLPASITRTTDWIADSLFATRMPNLEAPLFGDAGHVNAGQGTIATSGERNSWSDFTWVASGRTEGTAPTLGSAIYPISFAVQRSGWDADARYMHINNQNTSYTYSHRHPDDLSLIMAAYGRPLIIDPGSGDYSSTPVNDWMRRTTEAHNTIEVDGQPQEAGVTRASELWRSNEGLDVYRGEAHGYRPVIHDRVVYFVKPGFWIVSDALTGDTATHDYRQLWHFPGDPVSVDSDTNVATIGFDTVPDSDPVAGVQLVPVADGADLTSSVHEDGAARVGDEVRMDIDYLSYDWTTDGSTGLDTVVVPGDAGPAPSVTADRIPMSGVDHSVASALEIDLEAATGRFYLSREETPSSRSFGSATTDGETAYLERGDDDGALTRYALTSGSSLTDDGETIVDASDVVSDISVRLEGDTAEVSLGDPFTGTLQLYAGSADEVLVNGEPTEFTRTGDMITVSLEESFEPTPVFDEEFDESSLESTTYGFDDGSFDGWRPRQGDSWELGGSGGTQLAQTSAADRQSFAIQQDVPADVQISAEIVPGDRNYATARTGLTFRHNDARNYYRANVLKTREGVSLQLVKVYDGELTLLGETDLPIDADAAHTLSVSAVGEHLVASVGDTSVSVDDSRLPTGGAGAFTHRQEALFDDITITEALDQDHWQAINGDISIDSGQLQLTPTDGMAHALLTSALPSRFSDACDFAVETTVTIDGATGTAGISLRDTGNAYGYRIHIGKTSRNTQYASIVREAHRSGPVRLTGTSVSDNLDGPVELEATVHGDRITVTLNGAQILEARDTLVRSGGVGLYATGGSSTFESLRVAGSCEREEPSIEAWNDTTVYTEGDRVTHESALWLASWWTRNQEPGDAYGPWQEIAVAEDGTALWRPSRIFTAGDEVEYRENRYLAKWWTRNDVPGEAHGPWELAE